MAEKWIELTDPGSFDLLKDESGITGRRTFMRYDDRADGIDPDALPVVGTSTMVEDDFTTAITNCICRRVRSWFEKGHQQTPMRAYEYSTTATSGGGRTGNAVPKDSAARSYSMGVEQIAIDTKDSAIFEFEGAATGFEYPDQTIPVTILTGTIDIPNENQAMTQEELELWIGTQSAYGKAINSAAFEGYAAGQVRYDGFSGGEFYNADGELRFAVELHFSTRTIGEDINGTAITQDDWLYELNEKEGVFRKVKNNNTGKYLYEKKDFELLLDGPVVPP